MPGLPPIHGAPLALLHGPFDAHDPDDPDTWAALTWGPLSLSTSLAGALGYHIGRHGPPPGIGLALHAGVGFGVAGAAAAGAVGPLTGLAMALSLGVSGVGFTLGVASRLCDARRRDAVPPVPLEAVVGHADTQAYVAKARRLEHHALPKFDPGLSPELRGDAVCFVSRDRLIDNIDLPIAEPVVFRVEHVWHAAGLDDLKRFLATSPDRGPYGGPRVRLDQIRAITPEGLTIIKARGQQGTD